MLKLIAIDYKCKDTDKWLKFWDTLSSDIQVVDALECILPTFKKSHAALVLVHHKCFERVLEILEVFLKASDKHFVLSISGGRQNNTDIPGVDRLHFSQRKALTNADLSCLKISFEKLCQSLVNAEGNINKIQSTWALWDNDESVIGNYQVSQLMMHLCQGFFYTLKQQVNLNNETNLGSNILPDMKAPSEFSPDHSDWWKKTISEFTVIPSRLYSELQFTTPKPEIDIFFHDIENNDIVPFDTIYGFYTVLASVIPSTKVKAALEQVFVKTLGELTHLTFSCHFNVIEMVTELESESPNIDVLRETLCDNGLLQWNKYEESAELICSKNMKEHGMETTLSAENMLFLASVIFEEYGIASNFYSICQRINTNLCSINSTLSIIRDSLKPIEQGSNINLDSFVQQLLCFKALESQVNSLSKEILSLECQIED